MFGQANHVNETNFIGVVDVVVSDCCFSFSFRRFASRLPAGSLDIQARKFVFYIEMNRTSHFAQHRIVFDCEPSDQIIAAAVQRVSMLNRAFPIPIDSLFMVQYIDVQRNRAKPLASAARHQHCGPIQISHNATE